MSVSRAFDYYISYKFIRELTRSWTQMDAYKLGIIDEKGNILKKSDELKTQDEKDAYTPFNRIVWNLKKMLEKLGGKSKIVSYASAAWLLKENQELVEAELNPLLDELNEEGETPVNTTSGIAGRDPKLFIVRRKTKKKKDQDLVEPDELKDYTEDTEVPSGMSLNFLLMTLDPEIRYKSLTEKQALKRRRKVVRAGKVRYKIFCPQGKKAVDGRCVTKTAIDRLRYRKAARIRRKTMAGKSKTRIIRKAKKSMRRRKSMGLNRK